MKEEFPCLSWFDYSIDVTFGSSNKRIGKLCLVLLDFLFSHLVRVSCCGYFFSENYIGSSFGSHNCYLCSRPCKDEIGPQMTRAHGNITAAISFTDDYSQLRHCSLAVCIQNFCTMTYHSGMFLVNTRKISREVDKGDDRYI